MLNRPTMQIVAIGVSAVVVAALALLVLRGGVGSSVAAEHFGRVARERPADSKAEAAGGSSGPAATEYPLTVTDDMGREVRLRSRPARIISMSPPITEILFALGLEERIVGVTRFCDYPPEAKGVEKIGGIIDPSEEKIVSLKPDLVVATVGNPKPLVESLRDGGISVYAVDAEGYEEVIERIETIARICDVARAGRRVADNMREVRGRIRQKVSELGEYERPSVLLVVWLDPLHVAGRGTYLHDMLAMCGAKNAAAETKNPWKRYSVEMAVAANPDMLIVATDKEPNAANAEAMIERLRANGQWSGVTAVKHGDVKLIDTDLLSRTGPRLAEGLKRLAEAIHPDLFGSGRIARADSNDRE